MTTSRPLLQECLEDAKSDFDNAVTCNPNLSLSDKQALWAYLLADLRPIAEDIVRAEETMIWLEVQTELQREAVLYLRMKKRRSRKATAA